MIKKIIKIGIFAIVSTIICQIGMALTCINPASVMHMPTIKNTCIVLIVAICIVVFVEVFLDHIISYSGRSAAWLLIISIFLLAVVVQSMIHPLISTKPETYGNVGYRYPMLAAIGLGAVVCELFSRKKRPSFTRFFSMPDIRKPETVFTLILVVIGIVFCIMLPRKTQTGIDDESHYKAALFYSEGIYTAYNEDDTDLMFSWDDASIPEYHDGRLILTADPFAFTPARIGYIGPVIGLWFGQMLNLGTSARFLCGRISGLALYALVIYYAIKRLKNGKMLLGLIALAPLSVQLSVTYSYDAWLLAMTSLSFSFFFGAAQRPDEKITTKECIVVIGAMFIGTWVKMPYAVLFLILMLMPKTKFQTDKQYRRYLLAIICCILFEFTFTMMTSFGLGEVADYRGGSDVSGIGQIEYIKNNIGAFLKTLMLCVIDMLKPFESKKYLSYFYFFGDTKVYLVIVISMIIAAVTDNEIKQNNCALRVIGVVIIILLLAVIATSMYLAFTPVGSPVVKGAQQRYTLQLLLPCYMLIFSGWYEFPKIRGKLYNIFFYVMSAGCLIYNMVVLL